MSEVTGDESYPVEVQRLLQDFPEFQLRHFNTSGANGYVMLGHHKKLKRDVALKIYFHDEGDVDQEPSIVASLVHENILKVHDARNLDKTCSYYMMASAPDGDLSKYLSDYYISLSLSHKLLCQLLGGLSILHSNDVKLVHRDIKPENLLVDDETLFIADFGSVRKVSELTGKAPASAHSILYRPPESFGENAFFDYKSDIYQAGIIGYLLFGGALDNDLLTYLSNSENAELKRLGHGYEGSKFVDGCIEKRIKSGRIINWKRLPCYVPKGIVRILKNATKKHEARFGNVSEFIAELAKQKSSLPDWMPDEDGYILSDWRGLDYKLQYAKNGYLFKKRKAGAKVFRRDNRIKESSLDSVIEAMRPLVKLPK